MALDGKAIIKEEITDKDAFEATATTNNRRSKGKVSKNEVDMKNVQPQNQKEKKNKFVLEKKHLPHIPYIQLVSPNNWKKHSTPLFMLKTGTLVRTN